MTNSTQTPTEVIVILNTRDHSHSFLTKKTSLLLAVIGVVGTVVAATFILLHFRSGLAHHAGEYAKACKTLYYKQISSIHTPAFHFLKKFGVGIAVTGGIIVGDIGIGLGLYYGKRKYALMQAKPIQLEYG